MPSRSKEPAAKPCVVIVDDERSYVELICQMLAENLPCPVHGFTEPMTALAALKGLKPAVVVTDYSMPQMDGIEFIRKASRLTRRASFIMISGHNLEPIAHDLDRLRRLKLRMQKPFGWLALAKAVVACWPGRGAPKIAD